MRTAMMRRVAPVLAAAGLVMGGAGEAMAGDEGRRVGFGFSFGSDGFGLGAEVSKGHVSHGHVHSTYCRETPGYYVTRTERVLVHPSRYEKHWIEPEYEMYCDRFGHTRRIRVREGYYKTVHIPAHYEYRPVRTYIPGSWVCHTHTSSCGHGHAYRGGHGHGHDHHGGYARRPRPRGDHGHGGPQRY